MKIQNKHRHCALTDLFVNWWEKEKMLAAFKSPLKCLISAMLLQQNLRKTELAHFLENIQTTNLTFHLYRVGNSIHPDGWSYKLDTNYLVSFVSKDV